MTFIKQFVYVLAFLSISIFCFSHKAKADLVDEIMKDYDDEQKRPYKQLLLQYNTLTPNINNDNCSPKNNSINSDLHQSYETYIRMYNKEFASFSSYILTADMGLAPEIPFSYNLERSIAERAHKFGCKSIAIDRFISLISYPTLLNGRTGNFPRDILLELGIDDQKLDNIREKPATPVKEYNVTPSPVVTAPPVVAPRNNSLISDPDVRACMSVVQDDPRTADSISPSDLSALCRMRLSH
jgi:hypothetical protein